MKKVPASVLASVLANILAMLAPVAVYHQVLHIHATGGARPVGPP
jgi:hypothetical protein